MDTIQSTLSNEKQIDSVQFIDDVISKLKLNGYDFDCLTVLELSVLINWLNKLRYQRIK